MMFLLTGDVFGNRGHIGGADAERCIPCLPAKVFVIRPLLVDPSGGVRFYNPGEVGYGTGRRDLSQYMNMIISSIDP